MAESKKTPVYDESSIQVLEGLEAVRKRPGMYIGSTDSRGLHHLVWEIVDNAIDEALAGYGSQVVVRINEDNSVEVADNGRGIPTGKHKSNGLPTPQVIFNTLHAGGKFDESGGYKVSGGLHGVGSSVVNALSEYLEVTIHRDGKIYYQRYLNGGKTIEKPKWLGDTRRTGSIIKFKPDRTIFSTTIFDYKTIAKRLRESAFLIKGLRIDLIDMRSGQQETFRFDEGIVEFVKTLNQGKKAIHEPTFFVGTASNIYIEASIQYTQNNYSENILSFVNNIRTNDGGTHEVGFRSAITKAVNEHARLIGALKDKDANLEGADVREGLTGVLSIRIPENILQFEGQTKNKLGTPEARVAVENVVSEMMKFFLSENGDIANIIVNNAVRASKAREAARKARDEQRKVKQIISKPTNLLGKLTPAQSNNPKINELFLVEGNSAGGSAKQGRDRTFQAVLPLRGKVINSEKSKIEEVLKNEEIMMIINAIGAGIGTEFDISKINYNRIIIMTDADTDGAHIQILLLTFFYRFMPELVKAGHVYIATPPLYKISYKNTIEYAWSDEELRNKIGAQKNVTIQRYKGLGEMNAEQLWETTMNPAKRTLIQVTIGEEGTADDQISTLMGDEVEPRREWIENHVVFDSEDNFILDDVEVYGDE
ncbi:MAG: DNA topoisomerase IV subunit B [Bacilli bacterium]|nr:DNA topoisomerase IV subunit B [Bacilli bacterium]